MKNDIFNLIADKIAKSLGNDYCIFFDYDYDRSYNCGDYGCDGICRCGTLTNVRIHSVYLYSLIDSLLKIKSKSSIIDKYCCDRILRLSGIGREGNWEMNVGRGYYGDEIHGAELAGSVSRTIITQLQSFIGLSDQDKIKKILEIEYGYLLSSLDKNLIVSVVEMNPKSVFIPNKDYSKKLNNDTVENYKDYNLPRAICIKDGNDVRLIDGYHRMTSALKEKKEKVSIIVLE